ncbi:MAG: HEAT repeat domain-containing protein [Akkermansiaceae bacterium]|nr:HEAT repeat domain-containing protein [Akkermansiaceae bacterium]
MPEKTVEKSPFLERVPELQNRKWGGMAIEDGEALVNDLVRAGKPAVQALIDGLQEVDDGTDWKERLVIHQLVTQCSAPKRVKERSMLAGVLIEAARSDRPALVRTFLLQQLRLFAEASVAPRLAPLLRDENPRVLDAVTAAMVSMGEGVRKVLEDAMGEAEGHAKVVIRHALNQMG